jgi:alkylation response protein AidB-like acyl-CoA dehydrogenase
LDQFIFMLGWQTYAEHDGHRDAKIHTIFEGTSEIQQLVIAHTISGLRIE